MSGGYHGMIGEHPRMRRLYDAIERAAPLDLPVLIEGPTGSGKELVAERLHRRSRRTGPTPRLWSSRLMIVMKARFRRRLRG